MRKTDIFHIKNQKEIRHTLLKLSKECAKIWNWCVQVHNESWINHKKWLKEGELKSLSKHVKFECQSQTVQAIIEKYVENRDETTALIQLNNKARYPYKHKNFFVIPYKELGWKRISKHLIRFSTGRGRPQFFVHSSIDIEKYTTLEFVYDGSEYCIHAVQKEDINCTLQQICGVKGAIDVGEIHALSITNGEKVDILSGRYLRSLKQLRNKTLAKFQTLMSTCKPKSKRWWKLFWAKKRFLSYIKRSVRDQLHKISSKAVRMIKNQQINDIVYGDVDGVQQHTAERHTPVLNQKLSQWQFGGLYKFLEYKLQLVGIHISKNSEAYTSQYCHCCGNLNKTKTRNYMCKYCNVKIHRDANSALNFLTKHQFGIIGGYFDLSTITIKHTYVGF